MKLAPLQNAKKECFKFLQKLKKSFVYSYFLEFSNPEQRTDFSLFFHRSFLSLEQVKVKLEEKQTSYTLEQLLQDMKKPFIAVSDHLLSDDPLQVQCSEILTEIEEFKETLEDGHGGKRPRSASNIEVSQKKPKKKDYSTFKQKMEAVYFLKSIEGNEELIKKLGEESGVMVEEEDEYVFKFESNSGKEEKWKDFFLRK